jgi:hypothetical protein
LLDIRQFAVNVAMPVKRAVRVSATQPIPSIGFTPFRPTWGRTASHTPCIRLAKNNIEYTVVFFIVCHWLNGHGNIARLQPRFASKCVCDFPELPTPGEIAVATGLYCHDDTASDKR